MELLYNGIPMSEELFRVLDPMTHRNLASKVGIIFTSQDGDEEVSIPDSSVNAVTNTTLYDGEMYQGFFGDLRNKSRNLRFGPIVESGVVNLDDLLKEMSGSGVDEATLRQVKISWIGANWNVPGDKEESRVLYDKKTVFKIPRETAQLVGKFSSGSGRYAISPESELALEVRESKNGLVYEAKLDTSFWQARGGAPPVADITEQTITGRNY